MNDSSVYSIDEFEKESRYLDTLIWEAMAILPESKVLVCGYGPDGAYVQRVIDTGASVTVIEHRTDQIRKFAKLDAKLLRGSTSVIPAKDNTFDLAVSFHYLHEIDPFFHAQVVQELARVARRVAVVEPAPPADPLGKRIALLYSQAKRELGQFEYYQPLEYWKKLLQAVKADISQHVFAFAKVPPREYLIDTVKLLLDTIEVEEAPRQYMDELRQIANRSDVQLLPPPRFVLVAAAAGEQVVPSFTPRLPTRKAPKAVAAAPAAQPPVIPAAAAAPAPVEVSEDTGYEFPLIVPPPAAAPAAPAAPGPSAPAAPNVPPPPAPAPAAWQPPQPAPAPQQPEPSAPGFGLGGALPFGAPAPPNAGGPTPPPSFGLPFAVPGEAAQGFGLPPGGVPPTSTWAWEPPEGGEGPETPVP